MAASTTKKADLAAQNEAMKTALYKARSFIIITLIGLGYKPDTVAPEFRSLLEEIDAAGGFGKKKGGKDV